MNGTTHVRLLWFFFIYTLIRSNRRFVDCILNDVGYMVSVLPVKTPQIR